MLHTSGSVASAQRESGRSRMKYGMECREDSWHEESVCSMYRVHTRGVAKQFIQLSASALSTPLSTFTISLQHHYNIPLSLLCPSANSSLG